ncbi:MAG: adenylate cyclase [Proteobacteria bacterium]|nr:adenylate cyclase [Pseudomonadota bacterium]
MAKEIELKLRLSPAQSRRLVKHPLLSAAAPQKYRLQNTYYDTPDFDLRRRGIAVRLRRKGWALWLMTVKVGASGAGGLAQRSEWEAATQPGVFDFAIVTDPDLREFLQSLQSELQAVFTTDFTRCAWTLSHTGALIEIALDRGKISASGQPAQALCELELELLEGASPDPLFDLAIALAADLQLHPEIASKAERGYALADGAAADPLKAPPSQVTRAQSPVEAFRAIALSCLAQLQGNEAGAVAGGNPEFVHQARVAIRRLRSAFNLFAPVLNPAFVAVYSPRWRKLAAGLGSARDWDVFLTETLSPLEEAFPGDADLALLRARGEATKAKAQASAAEALKQKDYSQLLLAFSAALFRVEAPTIAAEGGSSDLNLARFARRRLGKRAQMIERLAGEHGKMNAERRHELRIAFKKLRYALEFFAPLLPGKRLAKYQASLATIQDLLGTLNDQVTASRLIKEMHPKGDPDPLTRGWIAGRTQLLASALNDELRGLLTSKLPWR